MIEALSVTIARHSGVDVTPLQPLASDRDEVWQIQFGDRLAVLTHRTANAPAAFVDVEREIACHRFAASQALAPAMLWHSAADAVFVCDWIESPVPADERHFELLGVQLARLHALPMASLTPAPTLVEAASTYLNHVSHDVALSSRCQLLFDEIVAAQRAVSDDSVVLSHRDPGPGNVVGDGAPLLVDWEYAGPATPAFDLAVAIESHQLSANAQQSLLQGYAAISGSAPLATEIARDRSTCRALSQLWAAALPAIA